MEQTETVADALPKEIARVREVLGHYKELGPAGTIGAILIEGDLMRADRAVIYGDVVGMLRSLATLRGIKG